jgi:Electron transfer flavoprotein, alpha subunit
LELHRGGGRSRTSGSPGLQEFDQRVLAVEGEAYAVSRYATDAAAAEALAREAQATLLLAPGTPRWSRALPGVAQRLNAKVDTHVTALSYVGGALTVSRWYYRQRIEVTLAREARPWVVLLDGGAFPAWAPAGAQAQVELVAPPPPAVRTRVEGVETPASDRQTIRPDAPLLFVAGAGWTKKQKDGQTHVEEAATLIADFVARAPCSLGSSKSLVDLSGEGQAIKLIDTVDLEGGARYQLLFPLVRVNFELGVIMVIAVSCVKLLSAHNSTQHTSRKHKV